MVYWYIFCLEKKKEDKVVREIIKKKGEIGVECGDEGKKWC